MVAEAPGCPLASGLEFRAGALPGRCSPWPGSLAPSKQELGRVKSGILQIQIK